MLDHGYAFFHLLLNRAILMLSSSPDPVMRGQSQLYPFTQRSKAYMLEGLVWEVQRKTIFLCQEMT
jgi:hypothetical protein